MISAIEAQEAKKITLTTRIQEPKMLLVLLLTLFRAGVGKCGIISVMLYLSQRSPAAGSCLCLQGGKKSLNDRLSQGTVSVGGFSWFFHGPDSLQLSK